LFPPGAVSIRRFCQRVASRSAASMARISAASDRAADLFMPPSPCSPVQPLGFERSAPQATLQHPIGGNGQAAQADGKKDHGQSGASAQWFVPAY